MSQIDQKPIRCAKCGNVISQIEPDEKSKYKTRYWKQKQDYWSMELHSWTISIDDDQPRENYKLCNKCKKAVCAFIKENDNG